MERVKPKIRMIVIQDGDGFSAFASVEDKFIVAMADTFDVFLDNLIEAINFSFEEEGFTYTLNEVSLVSSQSIGLSLMDAYKGADQAER